MARTKGSKNRPKSDVASQIAEKQETIASLNTETASIQKAIEEQKSTLKEKKTALKKAEKEVASLEAKKAKAEAKAAEEAKKAEETAKAIFTSGDAANMAAVKLEDDAFTDGSIDIVSLIHAAGLAATKSEARRVVSQGGASVAGEKVSDIAAKFDKEFFAGDGVVVKKGKKSFVKVSVN